jgi:hypothetical protein
MEIDAEMRRKIVLSVAVVVGFVAVLLGIGLSFGGRELTATGGLALVAAIVLFVAVMAGVGVYLDDGD